jgi:hypothetical protein
MSDDSQQRWWLVAQVQPLDGVSKVSFDFVRELTVPEADSIRQSNGLLNRLAAAAPYAKLFELFQQFQKAGISSDKKRSAQRLAIDMNRAATALSRVANSFPADLRKDAAADFKEDSTEYQQIELLITEECTRPTFRILASIVHFEERPFQAVADGVAIHPSMFAVMAEILPGISKQVQLADVMYRGVIVAQRLIGRILKIYEPKIQSTGLLLRQLAAEIPDGLPILMRADVLGKDVATQGTGPMSPEPLALDCAVRLHRAIRLTDELLKKTQNFGAPKTTSPGQSAPQSDATGIPQAQPTGAPDTESTQASNGTTGDFQENPDNTSLDLRALAAHATNLATTLEKAWSDALSPEVLKGAHEELEARTTSLLASIQRQIEMSDNIARKAGIDTRLGAYPVSTEEIKSLSFEPTLNQELRQAHLAAIDALVLLLEALNAMRAPSAKRISFPSGVEESWWEAGAFAMLRARARLLVQVAEQARLAAQAIAGENKGDHNSPAKVFNSLFLARESLSYGDALSAVLHARLAIMERAVLIDPALPADLLRRLSSDARLADEAPVLLLMQETSDRIHRGLIPGVAVPLVIAQRSIQLAQKICLEQPVFIQEACKQAPKEAMDNRPDLAVNTETYP